MIEERRPVIHFVHDTDFTPGHGTYLAVCRVFVHDFQSSPEFGAVTCAKCRATALTSVN